MKTKAQLARMTYRNQVDYLEDWFAGVRRFTCDLGTSSFEEMATSFRAFALVTYPNSEKEIDAAIRNTRNQFSEGAESPNPVTPDCTPSVLLQ